MHFSAEQIELAVQMKRAGLRWQPQTGQYALDLFGSIKPRSPFQPRVYYFHDFRCFLDYFGSQEKLQGSMAWLPTFEEIMQVFRASKIKPVKIARAVSAGVLDNSELQGLYRLLLTEIKVSM